MLFRSPAPPRPQEAAVPRGSRTGRPAAGRPAGSPGRRSTGRGWAPGERRGQLRPGGAAAGGPPLLTKLLLPGPDPRAPCQVPASPHAAGSTRCPGTRRCPAQLPGPQGSEALLSCCPSPGLGRAGRGEPGPTTGAREGKELQAGPPSAGSQTWADAPAVTDPHPAPPPLPRKAGKGWPATAWAEGSAGEESPRASNGTALG